MKFNRLTAEQILHIYRKDYDRIMYVFRRMCDEMQRKDLDMMHRLWHDPEGYEYFFVATRTDSTDYMTPYMVAGYKGVERFLAVNKNRDGGYSIDNYTNHFLLRFHNRAVAMNLVDRVNAYEALVEFFHIMFDETVLTIYNSGQERIKASEEGLFFCQVDKGMTDYMTFIGLQQLKDNQTEAINIVLHLLKEYHHAYSIYERGSDELNKVAQSLMQQLDDLQPQLTRLLTCYGRHKHRKKQSPPAEK